jgi:TonB-linked SusC/RagA family outer membrane protein
MKKCLLLPFLLLTIYSWGQTKILTGKIYMQKDGAAISGATVSVKGGGSVAADEQGNFSIHAPNGKITLQFHAVGYIPREITVGPTENNLSVFLTNQEKNMNEVVVVGYSDKKRSELTSAVSVVTAEKLNDVTTNDVGSLLQGKVAGLQVVVSSGVPGAGSEMRLRGISSVNANQSPLFVVDGIIGGNFDPNDVESVTVLKDAAATAMYGSQANSGVIVVTTKHARSGKMTVEGKLSTGFRKADFGSMKLMNSEQLYQYQKEFYRDYIPGTDNNSYKIDLLKFYQERPRSLETQNYSWPDEMFKPALLQNYYMSLSGKSEKTEYYLGLTFYNEQGTFMNTGFQRLNLRGGTTLHLSKSFTLTNNVNISVINGKSYDYNDIYYAYLNMPWDNPYDSAGNPIYVDGNSTFKWWSRDKVNPIHTIQNSDHPYKGLDVNYDLNFNINITPWLVFSSTNRGSVGYNKSTSYYSPEAAGTYHGSGYLNESDILNYGAITNDLFKAKFEMGKSTISGLAGLSWEGGKTETIGGTGRGLPLGLRVLNVASSNISVNGFNEQSTIESFISQVNYGYDGKYFLTGSYRVDGSSAFQANNRWGSFPAISAAWLASNEGFIQRAKSISTLKLRAGYGVTGTQDIGASRYLGLYSLSTQYNNLSAATPLQLQSPNLTWESKYQQNLGIDIGFFNRINLTVDVYHNVTKNLLLQVSLPLSEGFETRWENIGQIKNNGVEISLGTVNIQSRSFSWTTDFNINFNSNILGGLPAPFVKTGSWAISQIYRNGGNMYEFYMPVWLGVDPQTGAPLWQQIVKDNNGTVVSSNPTSNYAEATFQEVGSAMPKYQGGITNTFTYQDFSLSVNAYYIYGNKVYSNNLRFVMNDGNEPYYNQIVLPKNYSIWTHPGDIATNPSPQNAANAQEVSTRYLKDGSFISIRNITLSYNLPKKTLSKWKMQGVTLSVSADNVYTFTHFLGQDPQTTITSDVYSTPGVSDFKYPNNRQFLFNIGFRF